MSQIRDYFTKLPAACGVEPGLAEIYADHLGKLFDYELTNPKGAFNRDNFGDVADRIETAFAGWSELIPSADYNLVSFARRLGVHAARSYGFNAKGIGRKTAIDREAAALKVLEPDFPEVSALMTVEQASTLSNWA